MVTGDLHRADMRRLKHRIQAAVAKKGFWPIHFHCNLSAGFGGSAMTARCASLQDKSEEMRLWAASYDDKKS